MEIKNIIILNGLSGVGKTTVARKLIGNQKLKPSAIIDNDFVAAVNSEKAQSDYFPYRYKACANAIRFHNETGEIGNFIITDVYDDPNKLNDFENWLIRDFLITKNNIHTFRLVLSEVEREKRIRSRNSDDWEWQLAEGKRVGVIQNQFSSNMGLVITIQDHETSDELSERIILKVFKL